MCYCQSFKLRHRSNRTEQNRTEALAWHQAPRSSNGRATGGAERIYWRDLFVRSAAGAAEGRSVRMCSPGVRSVGVLVVALLFAIKRGRGLQLSVNAYVAEPYFVFAIISS